MYITCLPLSDSKVCVFIIYELCDWEIGWLGEAPTGRLLLAAPSSSRSLVVCRLVRPLVGWSEGFVKK